MSGMFAGVLGEGFDLPSESGLELESESESVVSSVLVVELESGSEAEVSVLVFNSTPTLEPSRTSTCSSETGARSIASAEDCCQLERARGVE